MIVIIDYNVGNLSSVEGAMQRANLEYVTSRDKDVILNASAIVLPGVGAFSVAMNNLKKYGLIEVLNQCKEKQIPILGICLGMQILFETGYEDGIHGGLGFIEGEVVYMDIDQKVPHMGWNQLECKVEHPLVKYVNNGDDVYFVHSYMAKCKDEYIVATSDYGSSEIVAIVANKNVMGCQFHPEKSQSIGMNIIKGFKEMIR